MAAFVVVPSPWGTLVSEARAGGLTPGKAPAAGLPPPPGPSARQTGRAQRWGGGESGEAGAGPSQQHGLSTPSPLLASEPKPGEKAPQPPAQAGPGEAALRTARQPTAPPEEVFTAGDGRPRRQLGKRTTREL